ncbi:MAG: VWA domain-containing protein, partial [Syntrophobacterales bacterium]|nr:VWA domain-containing protein [Syntrophobacterales bacterium]
MKGVAIHVSGQGPASRVTVAQEYRNDESRPVEAIYTFPLPEEAAVCGFHVELGGQILKGQVEDKEKCLEEYDAALARGAGAFLLDQDRPNVFTAYVGNLRPQEEVVLRLSYVAPLTWLPDGLQLIVPTVVSPRYFTAEQLQKMDPAELLHLTPPAVMGPLPYGFTLTVDLELPGRLVGVECPSHPFRWEMTDGRLKGAVAGQARMDQDFVLNVKTDKIREPFCLQARDGAEAQILVIGLNPEMPDTLPRPPLEVIFLADCSGSMAGESAAQVRNALDLCLRALEDTDTFNIIAFGSSWEPLFEEARPFDQGNLEKATQFVRTLDGHMGGTEMLAPLKAVLERPVSAGRDRKIILLTDGEVANEAEIIALAHTHRGHCALYPVGLGRGPNAHLIRSLARVSGGAAEFVHPQARLEPVMVRLVEKVTTLAANPMEIDWDGLTPDLQAPSSLPPLHKGEHLLVLARFAGEVPRRVRIKASWLGQETKTWELVPLPLATQEDGPLPMMLGREALRELEDRFLAGPRWLKTDEVKQVKERILALSTRYSVLSSLTSFLVVAERPGAAEAEVVVRRIPVALTRGWGGKDRVVQKIAGALRAAGLVALTRGWGGKDRVVLYYCRQVPGPPGTIS